MSCLDTIVSLGICPDAEASLSGFKLLNAPGISIKNLANVASENYVQGTELAMEKKELSLLQVKNDFIAALQANKVVASITDPVYDTSQFNTGSSVGTSSNPRGITIHKVGQKSQLRQTYLKAIEVYPTGSGDGDIKIYDGYNVYTYPVNLVADQINVFTENELDGFPFLTNPNSSTLKILLHTTVPLISSVITCKTGCNGATPNACAWADGWDGTAAVKGEGYGINVQFYCSCNYEQILCDLAKSYSGELIWLKWQINIFEEQVKSNRFNNWVVYNQDKLGDEITELYEKYNAKWNGLMSGMLGILNAYRDSCLNCRGKRWVVNL